MVVNTYRRYRKRKTIVCPDSGQIAEVELKAVNAGVMAAFGKHWVRVKRCSLWPRKKGCAEQCVKDSWWSKNDEKSVQSNASERKSG
jgi:hypothetical protein